MKALECRIELRRFSEFKLFRFFYKELISDCFLAQYNPSLIDVKPPFCIQTSIKTLRSDAQPLECRGPNRDASNSSPAVMGPYTHRYKDI